MINRLKSNVIIIVLSIIVIILIGEIYFLREHVSLLEDKLTETLESFEKLSEKQEEVVSENKDMTKLVISIVLIIASIGCVIYLMGGIDPENLSKALNSLGDQNVDNSKVMIENLSEKINISGEFHEKILSKLENRLNSFENKTYELLESLSKQIARTVESAKVNGFLNPKNPPKFR